MTEEVSCPKDSPVFLLFLCMAFTVAKDSASIWHELEKGECHNFSCKWGQYCREEASLGKKCRKCEDEEMRVWCQANLRETFKQRYPSCFYICLEQDIKQLQENLTLLTEHNDMSANMTLKDSQTDDENICISPAILAGTITAILLLNLVVGALCWQRMRKRGKLLRKREQGMAAPENNPEEETVPLTIVSATASTNNDQANITPDNASKNPAEERASDSGNESAQSTPTDARSFDWRGSGVGGKAGEHGIRQFPLRVKLFRKGGQKVKCDVGSF